jgi:tetratricopeptide (TPR) repeat protein
MKKILVFLLILSVLYNLYGERDNKDYTSWWMYNHGDYAKTTGKNDPRVIWALEVFEWVKNAADKVSDRTPRLFIIKTRFGPFALSLPDGGIIINPKTLDICYDRVDRTQGDRCLAFILGHELAHMANRDFIHRQAFLTIEEHGDKRAKKELGEYFQLSDPEKAREFKKRELLADHKGALFAVMAGYDLGELFRQNNDFLTHWAMQTGIGMSYDDDPKHPSLGKRLQFVRMQQKQVVNQLELFRAGVLLFQMENYRDAAAAFHEFSKVYPAREVFNNIGACYFSLAQRLLYLRYHEDYYRFRLSTTIAYETTAIKMQPRGEGDYLKDKEIYRYIIKAEEYFQLAASRDLYDRSCRYNLAAALIIKKKYAEALSVCNYILEQKPDDIKALNNKAIAFYLYGREEGLETIQKAVQLLQKVHQAHPENVEILYNLASLKQERERLAGAKVYWEKYLTLPFVPVDNHYKYIFKKIRKESLHLQEKEIQIPDISIDLHLGDDFSSIGKKWRGKSKRTYKLGNEENRNSENWFLDLQVVVKDNARLIILDGMIELVEMDIPGNKSIKETLLEFGPPQKIVNHTGGNFYVYKDKGFSFKEIKGRVYSYIWFEKGF